jgi:hypothetical protein
MTFTKWEIFVEALRLLIAFALGLGFGLAIAAVVS